MCDGYAAIGSTTPMRRLSMWVVIRSIISALFIMAVIWAAIADWPDCQVWELVMCGNAYWLWEMMILFVGWHAVIWWTVYWEDKLGR